MDTATQAHTTEAAREGRSAAERLFAGPGEMRARCRAHDWGATPLGEVEGWSPVLRTLVPVVMAAGFPSALLWGPDLAFVYNDPYIALIGAQHPQVLGHRLFEAAPETRETFAPLLARVRAGETVSVADVPTTFRRDSLDAAATTSVYTFSFAPVHDGGDAAGPVVGIHVIVVETTAQAGLRRSEERLRRMINVEGVGVLLFDAGGTVLAANDFFLATTGYSRQAVADGALTRRTLTPPEYVAASELQMQQLGETGRIGPYEKEYFRADGSGFWLLFAGAALGDGTIVEYCFDVSDRKRAEAALRESEARYRLIVEGARDYAIITIDQHGSITSWSPGAEEIFGWAAVEAVGRPFAQTFVPEDRAAGEPERELAAAAERGVAPDVRWHQGKGGARVFIDGTTRALRDERGRLSGFLKVGQDVTHRRALDEALRASEARYRTLVENVRDYAIFLLDAGGVVTEWTPGAERVTGYAAEETIGRHVSLFYTAEDIAAGNPARELAEAAETGRAEREGWRVRKGGARFWANEIATAVRDRDGHLSGFTRISRDLTEGRQVEQASELVRAAAERDALRRRLTRAEEDERRRLSRELHDEAGQHLTALALGLQALSDVASPGSEVDRRAAELRALASTLGRELHAISVRLRPRALDDFGLEAALSVYAEDWSRQCGVAAEVHARAATERLPEIVESAVYRIVQEALTNVARHSGATRASIVVERSDGHVVAVVEDDGCGFESGAVGARGGASGLGLLGMRERATMLGGALNVESMPGGGGTTLFVRIPVVPPDAGAWSAVGGRRDDG